MRLSSSVSSSGPDGASTIVPPLRPTAQGLPASLGASPCATSVSRLPPDTIWNGSVNRRWPTSHSRLNSARSMATFDCGLLPSASVPGPNSSRPPANCGVPSWRDLGAQAGRDRQIGVQGSLADPQRQQKVAHRDVARFHADGATALTGRLDARQQGPRTLGIVRTEREQHLARARPRQAEIDLLEFRLLAVAQVLDHQVAALEADLDQVTPVEPERAETVEPGEQGGEVVGRAARSRRRPGAVGGHERRGRTGGCDHRAGRDRPRVGGGEHRDAVVRLDAHRQFGADQIEALRPRVSAEQARACESDFGARRVRHHIAVGVTQNDVADAQRGAAVLVALEHGAADLDPIFAAEILLDGGGQPGRGEVERDRTAGQPDPQHADSDGEDGEDGCRADDQPANQGVGPKDQEARRLQARQPEAGQAEARQPDAQTHKARQPEAQWRGADALMLGRDRASAAPREASARWCISRLASRLRSAASLGLLCLSAMPDRASPRPPNYRYDCRRAGVPWEDHGAEPIDPPTPFPSHDVVRT